MHLNSLLRERQTTILLVVVGVLACILLVAIVPWPFVSLEIEQKFVGPPDPVGHMVVDGTAASKIDAYLKTRPHLVRTYAHSGKSLLTTAVVEGRADVVEVLLRHSANPNGQSVSAWDAPLYFAVIQDRFSIVRVLLEHGADQDVRGPSGLSAKEAGEYSSDEIRKLLQQHLNQNGRGKTDLGSGRD